MPERISRAAFATRKNKDVALTKAADLTPDTSEVGVKTRTAPFIISTAAVDRDGDTLALDGWDLVDYKKNPIVLFDHDPKCPIGKSLSVYTEGDALRAVAWFAEKSTSELADTVFKLIEADVLRTASVTFLPIEFTQAADRMLSSPWGAPPMNFKKQKLLEWSVVSVPSNQEALVQAKRCKGIDWRGYGEWIERALDESAPGHLAEDGHLIALPAPRAEYEKTYAVVKGFFTGSPRPAQVESTPMNISKAGKVLNKDNMNRLKAAMKHMDTAEGCHQKACDAHDMAKKHMEKCAEHMKAIMDSHNSAKGDKDESGDAGEQTADEDSKKPDDENTEEKDAGVQLVNEGSGADAGKVTNTTVKPAALVGEAEDYYEQYQHPAKPPKSGAKAKEEDFLRRAKAAIGSKEEEPSILDQEFTEAEMEEAMQIAVERERQKHLRELRGQVD